MREPPGILKLTLLKGLGPVTLRKLIDRMGVPESFRNSDPAAIAAAGEISALMAERVLESLEKSSAGADRIMEAVEKNGYRLYIYGTEEYPAMLREIHDPPSVLYAAGDLREEDYNAVAVVGTRRPTRYGLAAATRISRGLAQLGITVISGCALGIDAASHRAALDGQGRTIGILGSGLNRRYPRANSGLMKEIAGRCALLSEFPPDEDPAPENFPRRNRVVSGVSLATVVVEAPERSGALITAGQALEQGRDVLAVPGSIFSLQSAGCNRLIREGAAPAGSADDVLEEIGSMLDTGLMRRRVNNSRGEVSDKEKQVLDALFEGPAHADDISVRAGIPAGELAGHLTGLELKGMITKIAGSVYMKAEI